MSGQTIKITTPQARDLALAMAHQLPDGGAVTVQLPVDGPVSRQIAKDTIRNAPIGTVCSYRKAGRTLDQNARMWAMLSDISRQCLLRGKKRTPDTWKFVIMHACDFECRFELGLNGDPFPIGFKSSQLTKRQMSDLIEFMFAFGAEQGVVWSDPETRQEQEERAA